MEKEINLTNRTIPITKNTITTLHLSDVIQECKYVCCVVLYCAVMYGVVLCCTVLNHVVSYCVVLYCAQLYKYTCCISCVVMYCVV